jgi:hypothetical protein
LIRTALIATSPLLVAPLPPENSGEGCGKAQKKSAEPRPLPRGPTKDPKAQRMVGALSSAASTAAFDQEPCGSGWSVSWEAVRATFVAI